MKAYLKFKNNRISCVDVKFKTIIWEYICWVLGGRPDDHYIGYEKK